MRSHTERFWLDGGYDRDLVEACRLHPNHEWMTFTAHPGTRFEQPMTVCRVCGVPRCGESEVDGCDLPRHHEEDHVSPYGMTWPIGGTDPRAFGRAAHPAIAGEGVWIRKEAAA